MAVSVEGRAVGVVVELCGEGLLESLAAELEGSVMC